MEKAYTLREMNADDLFVVLKIVNKIGVKEFKNCFAAVDVKKAMQDPENGVENELAAAVGIQVVMGIAGVVVERLPDCKAEIYQFLASLSGMKEKEIAALPMGVFFDMVMDVVKHPGFTDFFQRVVGLFN